MTTNVAHRAVQRVALILIGVALLGACAPAGTTPEPSPAATTALRDSTAAPSVGESTDIAGAPPATPSPALSAPASPRPTPPAIPAATPTELPPNPDDGDLAGPEAEPFDMNLFRKGDFVAQYTFEWCVGASLQMAINMTTDETRSSRKDQGELWAMARDRSFSPFGGANPRGWTATLNDLGIGPYELVSLPTFEEALTVAAEAIRATKRPVGLVMWRGRHAWVMSGFESTADPRTFDDFVVTGIRVHDPLHPHGSSVWGPSPKPNTLISPKTLAKQFVLRDSTRVNLGVPPGYLLVLPVKDAA